MGRWGTGRAVQASGTRSISTFEFDPLDLRAVRHTRENAGGRTIFSLVARRVRSTRIGSPIFGLWSARSSCRERGWRHSAQLCVVHPAPAHHDQYAELCRPAPVLDPDPGDQEGFRGERHGDGADCRPRLHRQLCAALDAAGEARRPLVAARRAGPVGDLVERRHRGVRHGGESGPALPGAFRRGDRRSRGPAPRAGDGFAALR